MAIIMNQQQMAITIKRLCHQIIEHNPLPNDTVLIGIQPRGVYLMERMKTYFNEHISQEYHWGKLDITFYRDDIKNEIHLPQVMDIPTTLENKQVILIDDVLFTGRTIRSALDALLAFGRPAKVELCVLVDRMYSRQFPIQPTYAGKSLDSVISQKVRVSWQEKTGADEVLLF
jgi:pyrimidine operon attenuation protein / uracil phosphoribosyltransferase